MQHCRWGFRPSAKEMPELLSSNRTDAPPGREKDDQVGTVKCSMIMRLPDPVGSSPRRQPSIPFRKDTPRR